MYDEFIKYVNLPLSEVVHIADNIRRKYSNSKIELCNIMNAKSGICSEDCKFCAQSCHHSTGVSVYPLKSKEEILESARVAKKIGAHRFDIVASGNSLSKQELKNVVDAVCEIKKSIRIDICASLGKLRKDELAILKSAGLSRYHHNIETSERYFKNIVSTHTFQERIDTITAAKSVGLQVCSGGIIGMGEDWEDRISMALTLKKMDVDSVPLNILVPIKGTALQDAAPLSCSDAIRTIAMFRIILKDKIIKIAAGRETILKDFQALGFMSGANGMLIGGYLTLRGRSIEEDLKLVEEIDKIL